MADYDSKDLDERHRTTHPGIRDNRANGNVKSENWASATHTLRKGTAGERRRLVGDPFADKE